MEILAALKTIFAVIGALILAIFAKRYSDLKKQERINKLKEVEDVKATVINRNNNTDLESIVERENERARGRNNT